MHPQHYKITPEIRAEVLKNTGIQLGMPCDCGFFAAVFDHTENTVLKLTSCKLSYGYLTDYCAPQGSYAPKVLNDFGSVAQLSRGGGELYLLEIERLFPVKRGKSPLYGQALKLRRFVDKALDNSERIFPSEWMEKYKKKLQGIDTFALGQFADSLMWLVQNYENVALDLSSQNIMARSNGELVFNDPVFNDKVVSQVRTRHRSFKPSLEHAVL